MSVPVPFLLTSKAPEMTPETVTAGLPALMVAFNGLARASGTLMMSRPVLVAAAVRVAVPPLFKVNEKPPPGTMVMLLAVLKLIWPTVKLLSRTTTFRVGDPVKSAMALAALGTPPAQLAGLLQLLSAAPVQVDRTTRSSSGSTQRRRNSLT